MKEQYVPTPPLLDPASSRPDIARGILSEPLGLYAGYTMVFLEAEDEHEG